MILCMDKKIVESFDKIDTATKSAFTRTFNQENKEDLVGKKGKKGTGKGKASESAAKEGEEEEEEVVEDDD